MSIEIKASKSDRVRAINAQHPYMAEADITQLTGFSPQLVKAALRKQPSRRIKSVNRKDAR